MSIRHCQAHLQSGVVCSNRCKFGVYCGVHKSHHYKRQAQTYQTQIQTELLQLKNNQSKSEQEQKQINLKLAEHTQQITTGYQVMTYLNNSHIEFKKQLEHQFNEICQIRSKHDVQTRQPIKQLNFHKERQFKNYIQHTHNKRLELMNQKRSEFIHQKRLY